MNRIKGSIIYKVLLTVLFTAAALAMAVSVLAIAMLESFGAYQLRATEKSVVGNGVQSLAYDYTREAMNLYSHSGIAPEEYFPDSNFRFTVYEDNKLVFTNYDGSETMAEAVSENTVYMSQAHAETTPVPTGSLQEAEPKTREIKVQGYILRELEAEDGISAQAKLIRQIYRHADEALYLFIISIVLTLLSFVLLLISAGTRRKESGIKLSFVDKIPLEIFLALILAAEVCLSAAISWVIGSAQLYEFMNEPARITVTVLALVAMILLALLCCMSITARIKSRTFIKRSLCYMVFRRIFRALAALSLIKRTALITAGVLLIEFFFVFATWDTDALRAYWVIEKLFTVPLLLYAVLHFKRIRVGAKKIAEGDESHVIDTKAMYGELRAHGEELNNIRLGINRAVSERMKSERLRTELITNVSHDIKTPLTSIVNYVDLLSREELTNEKSREYVEVLQRQSLRLKKLTDDLVEASKASTGNLPVELEKCELGVMVGQMAGEYADRLEESALELIVKNGEGELNVLADGRHLWRIFDNLMGNICKYSQSGTRVYIDVEQRGKRIVAAFRNISKYPLNISAEELSERFVRGDSSRSTEGSGLGLSIAQSLAKLQGAELIITTDGDLFKALLSFPAAE